MSLDDPDKSMKLHQLIYDNSKEISAEDFLMVCAVVASERMCADFKDADERKLILKMFCQETRRITEQMANALQHFEKMKKKAH